jgi:very-short-patch-repair endonuclease
MGQRDFDLIVGEMASHQAGHIARFQALEAGGTDDLIRTRIRSGRWIRVYGGVYRIAGTPTHRHGDHWAGHLAIGLDSAISHESAGTLWRLDGLDDHGRLVLSVPHGRHPRVPELRVHQPTDLAPDVVRLDGLPITSPARTLFDLSTVLDHDAHVVAMQGAVVTRRVTPERMARMHQRMVRPMKPGAEMFARVMSEVFDGTAPPESELERIAERAMVAAGILEYTRQHPFPGREHQRLDFFVELARMVIEADGRSFHARFEAMHLDRQRDLALSAQGLLVVRVMWETLRDDWDGFVRDLRSTYEHRLAAIHAA